MLQPRQILSTATSLAAAGCGAAALLSPPPQPAPPPPPPAPTRAELTPAPGATPLTLTCDPDRGERCDGVDNNCDGNIDEGCGVGVGALQITATWNGRADLDLLLTGPTGQPADELHFDQRTSCGERDEGTIALENAHWESAPSAGAYQIALAYRASCVEGAPDGEGEGEGEGEGAVTASVSVAFSGRTLGVLNLALAPGGEADVATLTLRP